MRIILLLLVLVIIHCPNLKTNAQTVAKFGRNKFGVVTLNSQNARKQSFCFRDNQFVEYVSNNRVTNNCPDITFDLFYQNCFSSAFTPAYGGRIVNLGSVEQMRKKYKNLTNLSNDETFNSISFTDEKGLVLQDIEANKTHQLKEAVKIFEAAEFDTVAVENGSIYIVRFSDDINKSFQRIVKFVVKDFKPNKSVTIKWAILFNNQEVYKQD